MVETPAASAAPISEPVRPSLDEKRNDVAAARVAARTVGIETLERMLLSCDSSVMGCGAMRCVCC